MNSNNLPPSFAALLQSGHVSDATRRAMDAKIQKPQKGGYFNEAQLQTLAAVAARLLPQTAGGPIVDLSAALDAQMANGIGKGWRYEVLPPDEVIFREGMNTIEVAVLFSTLPAKQQDAFLQSLQNGKAENVSWSEEVQKRFFEELLAALTSIYYSHPIGRAEIGDRSFADLPNWEAIGLNEEEQPANQRLV